eukprot:3930866-Rhodomonas_salina.1
MSPERAEQQCHARSGAADGDQNGGRSVRRAMPTMDRVGRVVGLVVCCLLAPTHSAFSLKNVDRVASEGLARSPAMPSSFHTLGECFVPGVPAFRSARADTFRRGSLCRPSSTPPLFSGRRLAGSLRIRMDGTDDGRKLAPQTLGSSSPGKGFAVSKGKRSRVTPEDLEMASEIPPELSIPPPIPVYNWSVFGLDAANVGTAYVPESTFETQEADPIAVNLEGELQSYQNDPFSVSDDGQDDRAVDTERVEELEKEIAMLKEEHKDINEVSTHPPPTPF